MTDRSANRELILDILLEILEKGGYSHVILRQALGKYPYLSRQDRAFITRATEGTLEYLIQIDWVLNRYSSLRTEKMKPMIRTILRMSVYQILYMDRVPDSAACNEGVKLAQSRKFSGLRGFVNGILRRISREKADILKELHSKKLEPSIRYSIPEWLWARWRRELGEEAAERTVAAFLRQRPLTVRCYLSRASQEEIRASLESQQVRCTPSDLLPGVISIENYDRIEELEAFKKGWIQVQDLSSCLAGAAAPLKPGDYVVDVCAAPGGKSLHIADRLAGTGRVDARDVSPAKAALIEESIVRTGLSNIQVKVRDALVPDFDGREQADLVLADLPCSGLGILGKKPDIKLHITPEGIEALAKLQREILGVIWQYVKPGGYLLYSTCTISQRENQENAAWFLENHPFQPVDLRGRLGEGIDSPTLKEGWIQLLPGDYPCDGFFLALFQRR